MARATTPNPWDATDAVLIDMCRRYPGHASIPGTLAKTLIIGRTFSAAIERKAAEDGAESLYTKRIGPVVKKHAHRLDSMLKAIPDRRTPLREGLRQGLVLHFELMGIWGEAGAAGKRSLASKYLHFHRPDVFPLFDSRASRAITRLTPDVRHVPSLGASAADATYARFCARVVWLAEHIADKYDVRLSLRQLDFLLLAKADSMAKKK